MILLEFQNLITINNLNYKNVDNVTISIIIRQPDSK